MKQNKVTYSACATTEETIYLPQQKILLMQREEPD